MAAGDLDWNALLTPLVGPIGLVMLGFVTRNIRDAAAALQTRNVALDALATAGEAARVLAAKQAKDLSEAWGRIRALEGAVATLTGRYSPPVAALQPSQPTGDQPVKEGAS